MVYKRKAEMLVQYLKSKNILHDSRIARSFIEVPLQDFIPTRLLNKKQIYMDIPQLFWYKNIQNKRTISAPHMIVIMLENLDLKPKDNLLILGSKSGYISSIAAHLCSEGEIFILEAIEEIVGFTKDNLKRTGFGKNITIMHQNPLFGLKESAPWQKILVTGQIMKEDLDIVLDQLDPNDGVLFAPIGDMFQQKFMRITRRENDFFYKDIGDVVFGPLDIEPYTTSLDNEEPLPDFNEFKRLNPRLPITFKLDLDETDERFQDVIKELFMKNMQENEGDDDDLICEECEKISLDQGGVISLLALSDILDIEIEKIEEILKKSKKGTIKKVDPNMLLNAVFMIKTDLNKKKIEEIKEKLKAIQDYLIEIKNEINIKINAETLKTINSLMDELNKYPEFNLKNKKMKNLLNSVQTKNITLARLKDQLDEKGVELMDKYTREQIEFIDELLDLIKGEISIY